MRQSDSLPTLTFISQQAWEAWLDEHHANAPGLWMKIAKKMTGAPSVTYAEALESAICYGWIDGQKAALDAEHWLQNSPRAAPEACGRA